MIQTKLSWNEKITRSNSGHKNQVITFRPRRNKWKIWRSANTHAVAFRIQFINLLIYRLQSLTI